MVPSETLREFQYSTSYNYAISASYPRSKMNLNYLFICAFLVLTSIETAFAQVWEDGANSVQNVAPVEPVIRTFEESDFNTYPWLKEFTNVIIVNKADSGESKQTIRLYVNGKLTLVSKVSTGRETFEKGCVAGQDPKRDHCSERAYWSTTPVGYFDVDKLVENYFSNLWKTWMPFAVFFESGIATHQAPAGTEGKLGGRASGGCVRLHPNVAPVIYKAVQDGGSGLVPALNRDGQVKKTAAGDTIRRIGYKSLVIVENVVVD